MPNYIYATTAIFDAIYQNEKVQPITYRPEWGFEGEFVKATEVKLKAGEMRKFCGSNGNSWRGQPAECRCIMVGLGEHIGSMVIYELFPNNGGYFSSDWPGVVSESFRRIIGVSRTLDAITIERLIGVLDNNIGHFFGHLANGLGV